MASQGSFDDLLQCSICLERFTQPKALPCLHTFCLSCLRGIVKDAKTVDCPTCRRPHQVPEQGVVGFQDNIMAVNLLSMIGESTECYDCSKKQILSECEHCQQQVCTDCRAAHNRIAGEIAILIQSLELGILKKPDDKLVQAAQTSLNKADRVKTDILAAFDEAIDVLKERKEQMSQQVEMVSKIQRCVTKGTREATIEEFRQELSSCGSKESLKRMKESLMRVEKMLSGELEFGYDVSDVIRFGELKCGGEAVIEETTMKPDVVGARASVKPGLERKFAGAGSAVGDGPVAAVLEPAAACQAAAPVAIPPPVRQSPGLTASGFQVADRLPVHVDYEAKKSTWSTIICKYPSREKQTFSPSCAAYSPVEQALYCLSSGKLLKFDVETGDGKVVFKSLNATDLAITDSGTVLVIADNQIAKISPRMAKPVECDSVLIVLRPACTNAAQICSYRNEFVVLDSGKQLLLKFNEDGKLVQEIRLNPTVGMSSKMCVDREGRIYVTSGYRITDRKDNEDWKWSCCRVSQTVKVALEARISILTWDGQGSGQLLVDAGSKNHPYEFTTPTYFCPAGRYRHLQRDEESTSNEAVLGEMTELDSFCVDGDGYISVCKPGHNQIDVYDPKH